jgi:hypothetical protein
MQSRWQAALRTIVIAVMLGVVTLFAFSRVFPEHCDIAEETLATDGRGRSVVSVFRACTSFGTSLEERIELKSAPDRRTTIMKLCRTAA